MFASFASVSRTEDPLRAHCSRGNQDAAVAVLVCLPGCLFLFALSVSHSVCLCLSLSLSFLSVCLFSCLFFLCCLSRQFLVSPFFSVSPFLLPWGFLLSLVSFLHQSASLFAHETMITLALFRKRCSDGVTGATIDGPLSCWTFLPNRGRLLLYSTLAMATLTGHTD